MRIEMKKIILLIAMLISYNANAGFLTGVIVGSALSGDAANHQAQSVTIFSEKSDVISCVLYEGEQNTMLCKQAVSQRTFDRQLGCYCLTVDEYVKRAGYVNVLKVGLQFYDNQRFLLLEVSK